MNVRNVITFLTLLFLPAVAFAFGSDAADNARAELVSVGQTLTTIFGFLVGFIVFIAGLYKISQAANENQKSAFLTPIMYVLAGTIMMNVFATLDVFTLTVFGVDNFCQIIKDGSAVDSCMSDAMSGLTGELKTRVEKLSGASTALAFLAHITIIVGMFQVIGLIYFLVGAYGLTQVANGSSKEAGYAKPVITMFASALIIDIPHTAQMAIKTLEQIGINF